MTAEPRKPLRREGNELGRGHKEFYPAEELGTPVMARPAPHNGEMHPDGDEVLFLISGRLDVVLEENETQEVIEMTPGQTLIVPEGVWHSVLPRERSQLLHITPGPGGEWRPLKNSVPEQE